MGAAGCSTRVPQLVQKAAPGASGAPQFWQKACAAGWAGSAWTSRAPQPEQKAMPGRIFAPQLGQRLAALMVWICIRQFSILSCRAFTCSMRSAASGRGCAL